MRTRAFSPDSSKCIQMLITIKILQRLLSLLSLPTNRSYRRNPKPSEHTDKLVSITKRVVSNTNDFVPNSNETKLKTAS